MVRGCAAVRLEEDSKATPLCQTPLYASAHITLRVNLRRVAAPILRRFCLEPTLWLW